MRRDVVFLVYIGNSCLATKPAARCNLPQRLTAKSIKVMPDESIAFMQASKPDFKGCTGEKGCDICRLACC